MDDLVREWVLSHLETRKDICYSLPLRCEALCGDAGARCYFRLNTQPSLLLVTAPKSERLSECAGYFADLSGYFREAGVSTPHIVACDSECNRLLIEDFGPESYLDRLQAEPEAADALYAQALMSLLHWQQTSRNSLKLLNYDRSLLRDELKLFETWFVSSLLSHELSSDEKTMLEHAYTFLEDRALEQPQVLVHRDYHSRNIIYRDGDTPGIIDFQDAVCGPITYDVVSLLRDCYIQWPPERVDRWLMAYGNMALELGLISTFEPEGWRRWFDTMGLQRHIKVLGVFARLSLRDGKHGYLKDLPLVWHYVQVVAKCYPEMQAFYDWCQQRLQPLVETQAWYAVVDRGSDRLVLS